MPTRRNYQQKHLSEEEEPRSPSNQSEGTSASTNVQCSDCDRSYTSKGKLKSHRKEYHGQTCSVSFVNSQGVQESLRLHRSDDKFTCPFCSTSVSTAKGIKGHFKVKLCQAAKESFGAEPEKSSVVPEPESDISKYQSPPLPKTSEVTTISRKREFEELVLAACHHVEGSSRDKKRALFAVDDLGLIPITLQTETGIDRVVLAHKSGCDVLPTETTFRIIFDPTLRPMSTRETQCENCSPAPCAEIDSLLESSPYSTLLRKIKFVELSEDLCQMLNEDWAVRPNLKFICAKIFSGCIMLNSENGHAIMANCIESYGRRSFVDAHSEQFRLSKGNAPQTSIPPYKESRYEDIWPMTLPSKEGDKLVIGAQSFNALITSSIRLDLVEPPSLGGATTLFELKEKTASKNTKIFLDADSVNEAMKIFNNKDASRNSRGNELEQMRQVRSKFDSKSTYFLCRAASNIAKGHLAQPYSIFTVFGHFRYEKGLGRAAAAVFNKIGIEVLINGDIAELSLQSLKECQELCPVKKSKDESTGSSVVKVLSEIESLIQTHGPNSIRIIGNSLLNKQLVLLAQELSSYIVDANKTAAAHLKQQFTRG